MTANNSTLPAQPPAAAGQPDISETEIAAILQAVELLSPAHKLGAQSDGQASSPQKVSSPSSAAAEQARHNWSANLAALAVSQPQLAQSLTEFPQPQSVSQWLYCRDGSLTARDAKGAWLDGCSLPHRAAGAMLRVLEVRGSVACYVAPTHAAQTRVALDKMKPSQAMLVLLPSIESLAQHLACCDFWQDIGRHRLYFAAGDRWPDIARDVFQNYPGLPTPTQFIRTVATPEEVASAMMPIAERIFFEVQQDRTRQIAQNMAQAEADSRIPAKSASTDQPRLLLLAPSHFRMWDNSSELLARWMSKWTAADERRITVRRLDTDDPACASSMALTDAAIACDAIVAVDLGRGDLPVALPAGRPVVSWMTTPRIPKFIAGAASDALLLADASWRQAALQAGWPRERVAIGCWPSVELPQSEFRSSDARTPHLALIADTSALAAPTELERSSHRLLWEIIANQLLRDPLSIGGDPRTYLNRHMRDAGISPEGFNWLLFGQRLLIPAHVQGLARLLLQGGLPLRIHGRGWESAGEPVVETNSSKNGDAILDEKIAAAWVAPVDRLETLMISLADAQVIIHPWPTMHRSIFDALPRHILRPNWRGNSPAPMYLREAQRLLSTPRRKMPEAADVISLDKIVGMIR